MTTKQHSQEHYRQTSNIRHPKSQNLNVSYNCLILQLALPNPLKPGIVLITQM